MSAEDAAVTFKLKGKPVRELTLADLRALLPPETVRAVEPHESLEREYEGFPFRRLLDPVYGAAWPRTEEILFTCVDGNQPSIPAEQFQRFTAVLAFARTDGRPFELVNRLQGDEKVWLGPFYLVWDNLTAPALQAEGGAGWPYQVTGVTYWVACSICRVVERVASLQSRSNSSGLLRA